jgi:hypothetical protein
MSDGRRNDPHERPPGNEGRKILARGEGSSKGTVAIEDPAAEHGVRIVPATEAELAMANSKRERR